MASDPKKRKLNPPPPRTRRAISPPSSLKELVSKSDAPNGQTSNADLRIQQAKTYAISQARQDGCSGNFRVFDSPFGNFLVPAIPTREELIGKNNAVS
ncbi:hypothetical protein Dimus_026648 [Dionaea muscipula]